MSTMHLGHFLDLSHALDGRTKPAISTPSTSAARATKSWPSESIARGQKCRQLVTRPGERRPAPSLPSRPSAHARVERPGRPARLGGVGHPTELKANREAVRGRRTEGRNFRTFFGRDPARDSHLWRRNGTHRFCDHLDAGCRGRGRRVHAAIDLFNESRWTCDGWRRGHAHADNPGWYLAVSGDPSCLAVADHPVALVWAGRGGTGSKKLRQLSVGGREPDTTSISGKFSAVCAGSLVSGTGSGQLTSPTSVALTVEGAGTLPGLGLCAFSISASGPFENDALVRCLRHQLRRTESPAAKRCAATTFIRDTTRHRSRRHRHRRHHRRLNRLHHRAQVVGIPVRAMRSTCARSPSYVAPTSPTGA